MHQVVPVTSELLAKFFQYFIDICGPKICETDVHGLLESKLLTQLACLTGSDVKNSGEWVRVAAVGILSTIDFYAGMVDAESHVSRVVVGPEHVIDVYDDGFSGSVIFKHCTG